MENQVKELSWNCEVFPTTYSENRERITSLKQFIEENYRDKNTNKTIEFNITLTKIKEVITPNKSLTYSKGDEEKEVKARLFVSNNGIICSFKAKSSRSGYPFEPYNFIITKLSYTPKVTKDKETEFKDNCNKVLSHLSKDNLWTNIKQQIEFIKVFSYENAHKYYRRYWDSQIYNSTIEDYQNHINTCIEDYTNIYNTILSTNNTSLIKYMENNITTITIDDEFISHFNSNMQEVLKHFKGISFKKLYSPFSIMEQLEELKIKKMSFHQNKYLKYNTEKVLSEIGNAIDTQTHYLSGRYWNGYDASFEFKPAKDSKDGIARAWYSEEYKNCGNGHYYLALNRTHAMYWEKD